jgi:hypothetical protein
MIFSGLIAHIPPLPLVFTSQAGALLGKWIGLIARQAGHRGVGATALCSCRARWRASAANGRGVRSMLAGSHREARRCVTLAGRRGMAVPTHRSPGSCGGRAEPPGTRDADPRGYLVRANPWLQLRGSLFDVRYAPIVATKVRSPVK